MLKLILQSFGGLSKSGEAFVQAFLKNLASSLAALKRESILKVALPVSSSQRELSQPHVKNAGNESEKVRVLDKGIL